MSDSPSLTLLHLSDLHFGQARGQGGVYFDQQKVVAELLKDARVMAKELGPPDAVLVTGDIAFSAQHREYEKAQAWLADLVKTLELQPEQVWLVPGNHDVDRMQAAWPLGRKKVHQALRSNPHELEDYLLEEHAESFKGELWPKLASFEQFAATFGAARLSAAEPFWKHSLSTSLGELLLVGLNSCLLSLDGTDAKANLALSRAQLNVLLNDVPEQTLVLALVHHPPEWLSDGDALLKELQKYPHILFSGHVHSLGGGIVHGLGVEPRVQVRAGACHAAPTEPGQHSYAWIRLTPEKLEWYPRVYSERRSAFRADGECLEEGRRFQVWERGVLPMKLQGWLKGSHSSRAALASPPHGSRPSSDALNGTQSAEAFLDSRAREFRTFEGHALNLDALKLARILTAGRGQEKEAVLKWLSEPPSCLTIRAHTREEAILFVAAVVLLAEPSVRDRWLPKTCLIKPEQWEFVNQYSTQNPLLCIPNLPEDPYEAVPPPRGHYSLDPRNLGGKSLKNAVWLGPLHRDLLAQSLASVGLPESAARHLAHRSGGTYTNLRQLTDDPRPPSWAKDSDQRRRMVPLLLAGDWSPREQGDRRIVEQFARGHSSSEVESWCQDWSNMLDPPVRRRLGAAWGWRSHMVAWKSLSGSLTLKDLENFEAALLEVFGVPFPQPALTQDATSPPECVPPTTSHSTWLRAGLSRSLVLLILQSDDPNRREDGLKIAKRILPKLLPPEWRHWVSLNDALRNLAESAPTEFLAQVNLALRDQSNGIAGLHRQESGFSALHTELLWALEALAWLPAHFEEVVSVLAGWAAQDPGGRIVNRPFRSLMRIFDARWPQTNATVEERITALEHVRSREEEVFWRLLLDLGAARNWGILYSSARPLFRTEGLPAQNLLASEADMQRFLSALHPLIVDTAGLDTERWESLLNRFTHVTGELKQRIVSDLEGIASELERDAAEKRLWPALRGILSHYQTFKEWKIEPGLLSRVRKLYDAWAPQDSLARFGWLFCNTVQHPDIGSTYFDLRQETNQKLEADRLNGLTHALAGTDSWTTLLQWTDSVENAFSLGQALAAYDTARAFEPKLLTMDTAGHPKRALLMRGYINLRLSTEGIDAGLKFVARLRDEGNESAACELARTFGSSLPVWEFVDTLAPQYQTEYWLHIEPTFEGHTLETATRFIRGILEVNRPDVALDVASYAVSRIKLSLSPALLLNVLESLQRYLNTEGKTAVTPVALPGNLSQVLDFLETTADFKDPEFQQRVLHQELGLWSFLLDSSRGPKGFFKCLETNPADFAALIEWLYPPDSMRVDSTNIAGSTPSSMRSEEEKLRAADAYELLSAWKHSMPLDSNSVAFQKHMPWPNSNGTLDEAALKHWITEARRLLVEKDRVHAGEQEIGEFLARLPGSIDGFWPCQVARDLLEDDNSDNVFRGLYRGYINRRGILTRPVGSGGASEQERAQLLRENAHTLRISHPTTARLLRDLADHHQDNGRMADILDEPVRDP